MTVSISIHPYDMKRLIFNIHVLASFVIQHENGFLTFPKVVQQHI